MVKVTWTVAKNVDVVVPDIAGFVWSLVAMHFDDWVPGSGTLMVGPPAPGGHVHVTDPPGTELAGAGVGAVTTGAGAPGYIPSADPDPAEQPLPLVFCFLVDGAL